MKVRIFSVIFLSLSFFFLVEDAFSESITLLRDSNLTRYKIQTTNRALFDSGDITRWLTENHFDVAGTDWKKGQIEVITDQVGIQFLKSHGLSGKGIVSSKRGIDARYLNPQTLNQKIYDLARAYPNLTRVEKIGTTLQGRPILALLVSDTPLSKKTRNLDKPSIIFDGEHHAREVMTPEIVLDVASTMLEGFNVSPSLTSLLHNWNIWVVPMVNPDGSNLVFTGQNMWRKNARSDGGSPFGVDINRNYNYKWNSCRGSSGYSWAQDYRGAFAGSEPETQAIMQLAEEVRPSAYLSYHSYSELVLYPYGCRGAFTPEHRMVEKIAHELADRLPSDSGDGHYRAGSAWEILYDVDGDSMGYMYAAHGALSYTFEVNKDFQPGYALRNPTVLKHRNAWEYFLNRIDQNLLKVIVVDGLNGIESEAGIDIDAIAHSQGELPFRTNKRGRFFKVLDAGRYVVSARLADGRTGQVAIEMNSQPKTATIVIN